MSTFFDLNDMFEELQKMMRKLSAANNLELELDDNKLQGHWEVKQIDEPNVKGYVVRGSFQSDQPPLGPVSPFEPLSPTRRPLRPERPLSFSEETNVEKREPLIDVFDGLDEVKVYVELPGEEKNNISLNVTEGEVEIKAKNFYKTIKVPIDIDVEKASSKHRNNVLEVTLPKKKTLQNEKHNITIDQDGAEYGRYS